MQGDKPSARNSKIFGEHRQLFDGRLNYEQIDSLESDLRTWFLLFCNRTPTLAVDYLRLLIQDRRYDRIARGILKFSGALAQAAPAELAELTATILIPKPPREDR
jgi:hypothetical protein